MRRRETSDWVIARNEIHVTDKCVGKGEWCVVYEGVYCGSSVAVKQFHDFLITPYDVPLFEREMNMHRSVVTLIYFGVMAPRMMRKIL